VVGGGMIDSKKTNIKENRNKSHRGNASQFFVAGELCRRGLVAVVTMGNCPNTDILCSDIEGKHFVHIQVKTFVPGNKTCTVGMKAEKDYGDKFFWILGGIPLPKSDKNFEYYIIPATVMAKKVSSEFKDWLSKPGKKKPHDPMNTMRTIYLPLGSNSNEWVSEYKNKWELIEEKLC
jgi:hypothetical protein